jgi:hypothetical protein
MLECLHEEAGTVKKIVIEVLFFAAAAIIILPVPTLLFAYATGKTITEVLYR